jgi:hypothetical protein
MSPSVGGMTGRESGASLLNERCARDFQVVLDVRVQDAAQSVLIADNAAIGAFAAIEPMDPRSPDRCVNPN